MGRHTLTFLLLLSVVSTFGQGAPKDTLDKEPVSRPHILYFEGMGRAAYYNFGYGYAFFQREKHELNATIGFCYIGRGDAGAQQTFHPVGLFYRYGQRFKFEGGFSVTPIINWQNFAGRSYHPEYGYEISTLPHRVLLIPSVGFVWVTRNQLFEVGARYTPYIEPQMIENSIGYVFGAFFQFRLKGKKRKETTNPNKS